MKRLAFISRHQPTADQLALAAKAGSDLVPVGDRDGFSILPEEFSGFSGVVVVHAAAAIRCHSAGRAVGVFENSNRAPVGQKPDFHTTRLVVWTPAPGTTGDWVISQEEVVL